VSLRDNPLGELKVPLTWFGAVSLVVAIIAAAALFLSDRRETFKAEAYGATRKASDTVLAPVGDALAAPGRWIGQGADTVRDYFFAASENQELKAELKEMRQWRDVAIALRSENARYRTLLGLKTDPPIPMVAARIVTDSHGPFADTRLANAGAEKGVRAGNPVMSENGLVGRVIGVTGGASRVLLLTDIASRTPVMIDRTNARAILTGDGGPNPRLDYLRGRDPIREGDRVLSSGDGGVLPRGLPVGVAVKGLDGRWRVVLASDRAPIDFVRILLFQDFTALVNQKELAKLPAPPPTPGDPTATPLTPPTPPAAKTGPDATAGAAPKPADAPPAKAGADTKTPAKAGADAKKPAAESTAKAPDRAKARIADKAGLVDAPKTPAGKSAATKLATDKGAGSKPAATDKPKAPAAKPKPKPASDEAPA
jgi:rod shape-determining protein MreC